MKKAIYPCLSAALLSAMLFFCAKESNPAKPGKDPPDGDDGAILIINNLSSFTLDSVVWNGVPFGRIPKNTPIAKDLSAKDVGSGSITFFIVEKGISARTHDPVSVALGDRKVCELDDDYRVEEIGSVYVVPAVRLAELRQAAAPMIGGIGQESVTDASFRVVSTISDRGWPPVAESYFCYSTNLRELSLRANCFPVDGSADDFSMTLSGLSGNTDYFVTAYISNGVHPPVYSDTAVFATANDLRPNVRMDGVTNVSVTSVLLRATVLPTINPAYTEKGFCYSLTHPFPAKDDIASITVPVDDAGDVFEHKITSLQIGGYYVRAYVENSYGVRYSSAVMAFRTDRVVDSRDGKTYRPVMIGGQVWMAENLNYGAANSWCYGNNATNCSIYGRLYTWDAAMKACPTGWRLPSLGDWEVLVDYVGGGDIAGKRLKSATGWDSDSYPGTDDYGFSALPGGWRDPDDYSHGLGGHGDWWSSAETYGSTNVYGSSMYMGRYAGDGVHWEPSTNKSIGKSVRCIASD